MSGLFFYIDGHVRVYSGKIANLPKHFVSREKLCLSATTEFYVNTFDGLPLMVIMGELNERLKDAIEKAIVEIKAMMKFEGNLPPSDKFRRPLFTLVFDREAYEPEWFFKLWEQEQVAVISYRKNVKDKWDEDAFKQHDVKLFNNNVTMQLCERGSLIQKHWFREVRKRSVDGHQTAIITTHFFIEIEEIAFRMFSRWSQENFFKYMTENFDIDRMIQYGTEALRNSEISIPNPEYRQFTYQLRKVREKSSRLQARLFKKLNGVTLQSKQFEENIMKNAELTEQINNYQEEEKKTDYQTQTGANAGKSK